MTAPVRGQRAGSPPHTVQVSFHSDALRRDGDTLLGAWPTLPNVATAVARAGARVTVVQAAAARQIVRRDGVTYRFVDDDRALPARMLEEVMRLAPDLVHVHGLGFPLATWRLMRVMPGVPVMVQDHASAPPRRAIRRAAWRAAYRSLRAATFTTREQADAFRAARVLSPTLPVFEVLEGSSTFTPGDQAEARRATGMHGDPCILWTGHLDANKDPLVALEAFRLAAPSLPRARLWCCHGKAPLMDEVRRAIDTSDVLRERVTLLGSRPHAAMQAHFRSADFFIQASHREGCGYSILEALSCGTTPVVTDIPSSRRIVGTHGSLTPVGDAAAMAQGLLAWAARDPHARRSAARDWFDASLSFDRIGVALCGAYEAMLGRA